MGKGMFSKHWRMKIFERRIWSNRNISREKKIASQFLHRVILIVFSMELIYNFVQALIKWIRTVATFFLLPSKGGGLFVTHISPFESSTRSWLVQRSGSTWSIRDADLEGEQSPIQLFTSCIMYVPARANTVGFPRESRTYHMDNTML